MTTPGSSRVAGRRRIAALVGALALAAGACRGGAVAFDDQGQATASAAASRAATPTGVSPSPTVAVPVTVPVAPTLTPPPTTVVPTAAPSTPVVAPYVPVAGDVLPDAKLVAATVAATVTTYGPDDTPATIAGRVATDSAGRRALADALAPLFAAGHRSVGSVVYPQLGGLSDDRASVMVVVRQDLSYGGVATAVTRTLDVRLRHVPARDEWTFERLASAGGTPPDGPGELSAVARAVLDHDAITLPDSARWDIARGEVSERLLETMLAMADRVPYAVTVVASGHPYRVFDTDRVSNHSVGRAIDVYAVAGEPVVSQRTDGSPAHALARYLFHAGVSELGSPWTFGPDPRAFTNTVHQDHVHVGFDS